MRMNYLAAMEKIQKSFLLKFPPSKINHESTDHFLKFRTGSLPGLYDILGALERPCPNPIPTSPVISSFSWLP
jgi:hypothetical protein